MHVIVLDFPLFPLNLEKLRKHILATYSIAVTFKHRAEQVEIHFDGPAGRIDVLEPFIEGINFGLHLENL